MSLAKTGIKGEAMRARIWKLFALIACSYTISQSALAADMRHCIQLGPTQMCQDSAISDAPLTAQNVPTAYANYMALAVPGKHRAMALNKSSYLLYVHYDRADAAGVAKSAMWECLTSSFPDTPFGVIEQQLVPNIDQYCALLAVDDYIVQPEIAQIVQQAAASAEAQQAQEYQIGLALGQMLGGALATRILRPPIPSQVHLRQLPNGPAIPRGASLFSGRSANTGTAGLVPAGRTTPRATTAIPSNAQQPVAPQLNRGGVQRPTFQSACRSYGSTNLSCYQAGYLTQQQYLQNIKSGVP